MATAKTNIVGPIEMPDGSKPGSGVISFQLNKWDVELGQAVIAGAAESYALDVDGNFSASLWPPESGVNGRLYNVSLHYVIAGLNGPVSKTENLGPISFSGPGPLEIMSLLGQDIEEPTAPSVLALALSAQAAATAAAGSAQVNADQVAAIAAQFGDVAGAITAAEAAQDKSEQWAENPEDVEVDPGQYSAKHHAAKSLISENSANAASDAASTYMAGAEAARDAAIAAGAWDYTPNDAAALAAITGMVAGETALVRDTMHVWEYDGSAWVDTGLSPLDEKADKNITYAGGIAPFCTTTLASYTITVTPVDGALPPLSNGTRVSMLWPVSSDGTNNLYVTYNGVTKQVRQPNGANIALPSGMAISGMPATLRYVSAGVGYWISESDQLALRNLRDSVIRVSATSADGLLYDLSVPTAITGTPMFWMETGVESTGTVTFSVNGVGSFGVRYANNGNVGAGVIKPSQPNLFAWRGAPANTFVLVGTPYSAFSDLADQVAAIDVRVTDVEMSAAQLAAQDLKNLKASLLDANHGTITYDAGVRTVTPKDVVVINSGMSILAGATSGEDFTDVVDDMKAATEDGTVSVLDTAPVGHFVKILSEALAPLGNYNFIREDLAVNGSDFVDFAGQINGSAHATAAICVIGGVPNDADTASYNCGETLPGSRVGLVNAINAARAKGAMPLVYTAPCAHPTRADRSSVENIPNGNTPSYPYAFYKVKADYVFDAGAQTISNSQFSNPIYGGAALAVGETITITNGNVTATDAGNHVITAISVDRNTITVDGTLTLTGTENVLIAHTYMDEETYLIPPPSARVVSKDWLGTGVNFSLDVNYQVTSNMVLETCRDMGAFCLDVNRYTNEYVAANGGDPVWDWFYGVIENNLKHPRRIAQEVSYREANREFVNKFLLKAVWA
ncbi:MAG: hypothetical protein KJ731_15795 [Alphaproteobacteria bacterium]|nr:hypothetical protein [Alphaproteobacteria bacterium]MBU2079952.1 hypothetical protein [Alphaproteobacteria bacterium]MBU2162726.1 hypothetical protein [Alphaproteobacteria bacterium]